MSMPLQLCPHQMNYSTCPECFRANGYKPVTAPVKPLPETGVAVKRPLTPEEQAEAVAKEKAEREEFEARLRAEREAAIKAGFVPPEEQKRLSREQMGDARGSLREAVLTPRAPAPEAYDPKKLWDAGEKRELFDRRPRHPHAGEGTSTVLQVGPPKQGGT